MPPTTTAPPPVLPADVIAFAAEHGVSDYLAPVAEMTRQVFSGAASISVVVEDDYEVPDERCILFEIDVADWNVERIVAAQQQWTASIFRHCPATHVHLFSFVPWASA